MANYLDETGLKHLIDSIKSNPECLGAAKKSHTHNYIPLSGTASLTGHIVPKDNNTYNLGSSTNRWGNIYANTINVSSTSTVGNLNADMLDGKHFSDIERLIDNVDDKISNLSQNKTWSFDWFSSTVVFDAGFIYGEGTSEGVTLPSASTSTIAYIVASSLNCGATICAKSYSNGGMTVSSAANTGENVVLAIEISSPDEEFDIYVENNSTSTTLSYFITDSVDVAYAVKAKGFPHDSTPWSALNSNVGDMYTLTTPAKVVLNQYEELPAGTVFVCHKKYTHGDKFNDCFYVPSLLNKPLMPNYGGKFDGKSINSINVMLEYADDTISVDLGGRKVFSLWISGYVEAYQSKDYILYVNEYKGSTKVKTHCTFVYPKNTEQTTVQLITETIVLESPSNTIKIEQNRNNPSSNEAIDVWVTCGLCGDYMQYAEWDGYSPEELGYSIIQNGIHGYSSILCLTEDCDEGGFKKGDFIKMDPNGNWKKYYSKSMTNV